MVAYQDVPMSFADACLVRMVEVQPDSRLYTTDRHFRIYRAHGSRRIEALLALTIIPRRSTTDDNLAHL